MTVCLPKKRPTSFLGPLSPDEFLEHYWQKQPLLLRGALRDQPLPVSRSQLFALAQDPEVESRLVKRNRNKRVLEGSTENSNCIETSDTYSLDLGPFSKKQLTILPAQDWTLLVQDLEQHTPLLQSLLDWLDFLPEWRKDDVMASFATQGGSVGPHFDQYDVFLVQVQGSRRWELSSNFDPTALQNDSDLQILSKFEPELSWDVDPGDIIYLPPNIAHFGVANEESITLSLGCRSASLEQLLQRVTWDACEGFDESRRVAEPTPMPAGSHLTTDDLHWLRPLLQSSLFADQSALPLSFARLVTEPKALFALQQEPLNESELASALQAKTWRRRPGSRWLRLDAPETHWLVIDGNSLELHAHAVQLANELAANRELHTRQLNPTEHRLLSRLLRNGQLVVATCVTE